jgi:hypothetical protein
MGSNPLLTGTAFITMAIVYLVIYIFTAICLLRIAKKTAQGPNWWAWVPIANCFLMCKIAGLPYWWLFGLLFSFIPILNLLVIALFVYVWYKIALALNKPGWIGILTIIPIVNLVVMGYLAFSE